ncbi:MAG: hypothetical protein AB3N13_13140 [Arenibacterium sp.]
MGEMLAERERQGEPHNDLEAIDRVLGTLGYEGETPNQTEWETRTANPLKA